MKIAKPLWLRESVLKPWRKRCQYTGKRCQLLLFFLFFCSLLCAPKPLPLNPTFAGRV